MRSPRLLPDPADSGRAVLAKVLALAVARAETGGPPPLAVDATAGNGHDTLFLAENVGPRGRVLAFDVQERALAAASARLREAGLLGRVLFVAAGHETLGGYLPQGGTQSGARTGPQDGPPVRKTVADAVTDALVDAAMFNLGFLPGSDKAVVTRPESTLAALRVLETRLRAGGVVSVHCYAGHPGGAEEADAVERWARALPWEGWRVLRLGFANKTRNPEISLLAERLG